METQRLIIQMAYAADVMGQGLQSAAQNAIVQALHQADLPALDMFDAVPHVRVTLGVPDPNDIDAVALETLLPDGGSELVIMQGGQLVTDQESGRVLNVATAAAEVFLPKQTGWVLRH